MNATCKTSLETLLAFLETSTSEEEAARLWRKKASMWKGKLMYNSLIKPLQFDWNISESALKHIGIVIDTIFIS